jgi:hypothetical protein
MHATCCHGAYSVDNRNLYYISLPSLICAVSLIKMINVPQKQGLRRFKTLRITAVLVENLKIGEKNSSASTTDPF